MELHPTQQAAVDKACNSPFTIIIGSAGTGKTTLIAAIANRLASCDRDFLLCALSGKAASRLREATGRHTSTVHSMLKFDGKRFMAGSLCGTAIIIDESSMIGSALLSEIIVRRPSCLILIGDESQLPPVDRGQPFHDMIMLRPDLVMRLTICWRQSEAVYRAANAVRQGQQPQLHETSAQERWEIRNTGGPSETHAAIMAMVSSGEITFDKGTDIILCPRNGKFSQETKEYPPATVNALNANIVKIVNPRDGDEKFRSGDRVINTKNQPEHDVWNGTTGTVHSVDIDGQVWVDIDVPRGDGETIVLFDKEMAKSLSLAYALSVHKSQGSQYRKVVFTALSRDLRSLLDRAMAYTAITRTKSECIVVGQPGAFYRAIEIVNSKRTVIQELAKQ